VGRLGHRAEARHEPIVVAQKPREGTFAQNVLKHGVGGLNIDGCRVRGITERDKTKRESFRKSEETKIDEGMFSIRDKYIPLNRKGRWPANVILGPKAARLVDKQSGERKSGKGGFTSKVQERNRTHQWSKTGNWNSQEYLDSAKWYYDSGGASRFFYCAKAHKSERNAGLEDLEDVESGVMKGSQDGSLNDWGNNETPKVKNDIATLKPINPYALFGQISYPADGIVLDPFAGSGTTGIACVIEGFRYILIEKRERFAKVIAPKRIEYWSKPENWKKLKEHEELEKPKKAERLDKFT